MVETFIQKALRSTKPLSMCKTKAPKQKGKNVGSDIYIDLGRQKETWDTTSIPRKKAKKSS